MGVNKVRAVFLDRDGVINRSLARQGKPYPPPSVAELEVLPDVDSALARLREAGFYLVVVTNQPDVARGTQKREVVEAIHATLQSQLPLDEIRVCYHDDADQCNCRKPKPGMLLSAAREANIDLARSFMIGDRWRDIEAGHQAGCATLFIDYQYAEAERSQPHARVTSLAEAAAWILTHAD